MSLRPAALPAARSLRLPGAAEVATLLTVLAIAALFLVSSKVLQWAGLPYATSGGPALAKFHPATFLSLAALAATLVALGPVRVTAALAFYRPGIIAFSIAIVLLTWQAVIVQKLPLSAIVDTFVMPVALFVSILALPRRVRGRLAVALHLFFLVNSTIGYAEYFTGWRLTPYYNGGEIITYDWRATALLGHPLSNALITGIYLLIVTGAGGSRIPMPGRTFLILYNLGAMAAFGGRAATLVGLGLMGLCALWSIATVLAGRRVERRSVLTLVVAATLVVLLGTLIVQFGLLDSFLARFEDDSGSAATRVAMFYVFDGTSWHDFLFKPDLDHIAANQRRLDLAIAIESFIVAFFAYYGAATTVLFFAGLAAFVGELLRAAGIPALLPLAYYFIVTSSSTGIANKTIDLAIVTAMVLILLDRELRAPRGTRQPC